MIWVRPKMGTELEISIGKIRGNLRISTGSFLLRSWMQHQKDWLLQPQTQSSQEQRNTLILGASNPLTKSKFKWDIMRLSHTSHNWGMLAPQRFDRPNNVSRNSTVAVLNAHIAYETHYSGAPYSMIWISRGTPMGSLDTYPFFVVQFPCMEPVGCWNMVWGGKCQSKLVSDQGWSLECAGPKNRKWWP